MPEVTKPTVVYRDKYMRIVRRPDRPGQRAYFDIEGLYTDAMGDEGWRHLDSFGRDDSDSHGKDWIKQLLARIVEGLPTGGQPSGSGQS